MRIENITEREIERWRAGLSGSRKGRETLSNKTKNHQLVLMHAIFGRAVKLYGLPGYRATPSPTSTGIACSAAATSRCSRPRRSGASCGRRVASPTPRLRQSVNGHLFLPKYGNLFSPAAAMISPRWWPSFLPTTWVPLGFRSGVVNQRTRPTLASTTRANAIRAVGRNSGWVSHDGRLAHEGPRSWLHRADPMAEASSQGGRDRPYGAVARGVGPGGFRRPTIALILRPAQASRSRWRRSDHAGRRRRDRSATIAIARAPGAATACPPVRALRGSRRRGREARRGSRAGRSRPMASAPAELEDAVASRLMKQSGRCQRGCRSGACFQEFVANDGGRSQAAASPEWTAAVAVRVGVAGGVRTGERRSSSGRLPHPPARAGVWRQRRDDRSSSAAGAGATPGRDCCSLMEQKQGTKTEGASVLSGGM
jgi:hypothetical protein